jgi:hypothetical protein
MRMDVVRQALPLLAALGCAACGAASGAGDGDSGSDAFPGDGNVDAAEVPDAARCPVFINSGDMSCSETGTSCIECEEGVGLACTCTVALNDGGGGNHWVCIGTGHPCP